MGRLHFVSETTEGVESIMSLKGLNATEVRFNNNSREIFIIIKPPEVTPEPKVEAVMEPGVTYVREELDDLHWSKVKKLVIHARGEWSTKEAGIKFLLQL